MVRLVAGPLSSYIIPDPFCFCNNQLTAASSPSSFPSTSILSTFFQTFPWAYIFHPPRIINPLRIPLSGSDFPINAVTNSTTTTLNKTQLDRDDIPPDSRGTSALLRSNTFNSAYVVYRHVTPPARVLPLVSYHESPGVDGPKHVKTRMGSACLFCAAQNSNFKQPKYGRVTHISIHRPSQLR